MSTPEHDWEWRSLDCDICGEAAPYELWCSGTLMQRYCEDHYQEKRLEEMRFWHLVEQLADQEEQEDPR